jgi:hypothetical protein
MNSQMKHNKFFGNNNAHFNSKQHPFSNQYLKVSTENTIAELKASIDKAGYRLPTKYHNKHDLTMFFLCIPAMESDMIEMEMDMMDAIALVGKLCADYEIETNENERQAIKNRLTELREGLCIEYDN